MRTVYLTSLPVCCLCEHEEGMTVPAVYDTPIVGARWGYVCEAHMETRGSVAMASRLAVGPEPEVCLKARRKEVRAAVEAGDFSLAEDLIGDGDIVDFL